MAKSSARGLARAELGMTPDEVKRAVGSAGEPIFEIADEHEYACRKFVSKANGVPYYFLWKDGFLSAATSAIDCKFLERAPGKLPEDQGLPHENGYGTLLDRFEPPLPPEHFDFQSPSPNFETRAERRKQARGEWLMWSPLIILFLPYLPLTIPAGMYDDTATAASYARVYDVHSGMDLEAIEKLLGTPDHVQGDATNYAVYTYHIRPADGESMWVSAGFREGRSVWVRYRYNAYAESTGTKEEPE